MGCTVSSTLFTDKKVMIDEEETEFTEMQKVVVIKQWAQLSTDITGVGELVFVRIFELQPSFKVLFHFEDLEGEKLTRHPLFKGHASRFMQAVGNVIENIDSYNSAVGPVLHDLGRQHTTFAGFQPQYWNDFETAILDVWTMKFGLRFTPDAKAAWQMVFRFILRKLKEGYHRQLQEQHSDAHKKLMLDKYACKMDSKQKTNVKKTWKLLSGDLADRGARVFIYIFDLNPEVKKIFPCRDKEGDDLLKDASFKTQAFRFMQAVGAVVENIDNYDEVLSPVMAALGRKHIHFKGFKPEYFDIFEKSIMLVWAEDLGTKFNNETRVAWHLVFQFILKKLLQGYHEAFAEYHKNLTVTVERRSPNFLVHK